jgi:hypothetical protein
MQGETSSYRSGQRGTKVTLMCCMSSSESYVTPVMILKEMKLQDEMTAGRGPLFTYNENGLDNFDSICQVAEAFYYFFSQIDKITKGPSSFCYYEL